MRHDGKLGEAQYKYLSRQVKALDTARLLGPSTTYVPVPARIGEEYARTLDVVDLVTVHGDKESTDMLQNGTRVPILQGKGIVWAIFCLPEYRKRLYVLNKYITSSTRRVVVRNHIIIISYIIYIMMTLPLPHYTYTTTTYAGARGSAH